MDELELRVYHGYRDALRKLWDRLSSNEPSYRGLPVILVDYHEWEVFYFEDEYKAQSFLDDNYTSWDEEPPYGEDEDLIIFKFYSEEDMSKFPNSADQYKFYRELNGNKFYRCKTHVCFEPELIINVSF